MDTYTTETIKECEELIVRKSMNLDIVSDSIMNGLELIFYIIDKIAFISVLAFIGIKCINGAELIYILKIVGCYLCIKFLAGVIVRSAKMEYYEKLGYMRSQLINNIANSCKEYKENKYDEWQLKQMAKRFLALTNCNIDWSNNAK